MKIEEAIQQSKFKNEVQRAEINILYTASFLQGLRSKVFKKYGISGQQYNVLRIVKGQSPNAASVQLINDRMIDASSNVSRIVDKLLEKKLVSRKVCKQDRRQVDIRVTEKAIKLIDNVAMALEAQFEDVHGIDQNALEALNDCLDLIRLKTKTK